jgi:hypothetical protein
MLHSLSTAIACLYAKKHMLKCSLPLIIWWFDPMEEDGEHTD